MIVEALSFKLALDFLQYLKKNRISANGIKVIFWDRVKNEYTTYEDVDKMSSYFSTQYRFIDNCVLGALCSIQLFRAESDLYDFRTEYTAVDITGSYKLTTGSQYDIQRNTERSILINRQVSFINQAVNEYLSHFNEIKRIYVTGIYSPCYAVPGWSEGTSYLNALRLGLLGTNDSSFPSPSVTQQPQPVINLNTVNYFEIQRKNILAKLNQELLIITNRILFIEDIINSNININATPINDIIDYLENNGFDKIDDSYNYLLNMPIFTLNSQTLLDLQQLKINKENEIISL